MKWQRFVASLSKEWKGTAEQILKQCQTDGVPEDTLHAEAAYNTLVKMGFPPERAATLSEPVTENRRRG